MELVISKGPVERKVSKEPVEDGYTHKKKNCLTHKRVVNRYSTKFGCGG